MLISPDEIKKSLAEKNWIYNDKTIKKSFQFNTYMEGIEFINKVAQLSETHNHHPDMNVGWCRVDVSITSHDLGGVTTKCINLAMGLELI